MPTDRLKVLLIPDTAALAVAGYDLTPKPATGRREVSGSVNGAVRRYAALIEKGAIELEAVLSRAEWNAIADANNGGADLWDYTDGPTLSPLTAIWANVHDTPGLGSKWGIDAGELVRKLQVLAPHHGEALAAAVRWFWDHCQSIDHQIDEWWLPSYRRQSLVKE